jgi:hypothetical protein
MIYPDATRTYIIVCQAFRDDNKNSLAVVNCEVVNVRKKAYYEKLFEHSTEKTVEHT